MICVDRSRFIPIKEFYFQRWALSCNWNISISFKLKSIFIILLIPTLLNWYLMNIIKEIELFNCLQLSIGVSVLCVPVLRWTQPDLIRPIRVSLFFPVIYIIATLFVTIVPMWVTPYETGKSFLSILNRLYCSIN